MYQVSLFTVLYKQWHYFNRSCTQILKSVKCWKTFANTIIPYVGVSKFGGLGERGGNWVFRGAAINWGRGKFSTFRNRKNCHMVLRTVVSV